MHNKSLYQIKDIRKLEQLAVDEGGIELAELMQRAGTAAFREFKNRWPDAQKITVVCGKGNNGGDGYVLAKLAKQNNLQVSVLSIKPTEELRGIAKDAAQACQNLGINIEPFCAEKLQNSNIDIIIDAILGIGISGAVSETYKNAIDAINASNIPILAIDVPSGLNADTGNVLGSVVRAAITVTFIGLKPGLFTGVAANFCGDIICDDLGLSKEIFDKVSVSTHLLDLQNLKTFLPKRPRAAHKGHFGHVLVIGGDYGMGGAVRMAAEAAARVGAGLISVATHPEHIFAINAARPELMCHGITFSKQLDQLLERADVMVLGPGLGKSKWSKQLWERTINVEKPLILDADALNLLAEFAGKNKLQKNNWILTPHPGEAARLLNLTSSEIQCNRFAALNNIIKNYAGTCVLKGAGTLIGNQDTTKNIGVCNAGNPGMASGGMGDILSGVIGGLVAQGLDLFIAAQLGVCVHAYAADLAAKDKGERGLLATDLLPYLRELVN